MSHGTGSHLTYGTPLSLNCCWANLKDLGVLRLYLVFICGSSVLNCHLKPMLVVTEEKHVVCTVSTHNMFSVIQ